MEWEFKRVTFAREASRNAVRLALTHAAEADGWELARVRIHRGGHRDVTLRRKIIRMRATW